MRRGLVVRLVRRPASYERIAEAQRSRASGRCKIGGHTFALRALPPSLPELAGTERILFLGGSFTYCTGVDERFMFVERVEKASEGRQEAWNGGSSGSLTSERLEFGRSALDLWSGSFNQHRNAEGHRLAADAVSAFLEPSDAVSHSLDEVSSTPSERSS